jgi:hypothetical protein
LLLEFEECLKLVNQVFDTQDYTEKAKLNLAYQMFFYGSLGAVSERILIQRFGKTNFASKLTKLIEESKSVNVQRKSENKTELFMGHQSELGHYFRQMYQCVTFIDKQDTSTLSYKEKYQYVKTLRVQLSNQEQALLFFNSLSDIGKPWEFGSQNDNDKLITKYNLVKNIPEGYTKDINVKTYFNNVHFEGEVKTSQRIELEKQYR